MGRISGRLGAGIGVVVAGVALWAPAVAAANDFYVANTGNDANPCTQLQPCLTVQHAVGMAGATGDTVHVGPGTYAEGVSTSIKNVTLLGAGPGEPNSFNPLTDTQIRPGASADPAIRMQGGGTVRGFRLEGASKPPAVDTTPGLFLSALNGNGVLRYTVEDVIATGGLVNSLRDNAMLISDAGTGRTIRAGITNSRANFQGGAGVLVTGANVSATLTDSEAVPLASGKQVGVGVMGGAAAVLNHSRIGDNFPLAAGVTVTGAGSFAGFVRSTVRVQGVPVSVSTDAGTVQAIAIDSEFVNLNPGLQGGTGVRVDNNSNVAGSHSLFAARNSTIVTRAPSSTGVTGLLLRGSTVAGSTAEATFQNSVAKGIDTDSSPIDFDVVSESGRFGVFTADHSSFTDVSSGPESTITSPGSNGNVVGDPRFANPAAGDFSLAPDSPLVDAGGPPLGAAELDLDGNPRSLDGDGDCTATPDIGAHERPAATCPTPAQGGGGEAASGGGTTSTASGGNSSVATTADLLAATISGFGMERKRFAVGRKATAVAGRRKKKTPRGSAFKYTLSEPATVRIAIERKSAGLKSGRRCVKPTAKLRRRKAKRCTRLTAAGTLTRAGASGANRVAFSGRIGRKKLKPGKYRATIDATDAAGNASTPATTSFTIVRR